MTMPKFDPVAEVLWYAPELRITPEPAGKIIDSSMSFIESAAIGTPLYTLDQLTEAYEAGKRDAIPEDLFEDAKIIFCSDSESNTNGDCLDVIEWFKAMLAAAPKGEE